MNTALWCVQAVLAFAFGMAGVLKLVLGASELKAKGNGRMDWVDDVSPASLKLIGALELAGALGLILPMVTGIVPALTSAAAAGLALTMLGAIALHAKRGDELQAFIINGVLLTLAAFVAWGRF
ncbi:MAG: DoxX family protein [Gammaproteobacteria bacterium]|nr:DoxX family protein [Gammaproteobacteria bacterium]